MAERLMKSPSGRRRGMSRKGSPGAAISKSRSRPIRRRFTSCLADTSHSGRVRTSFASGIPMAPKRELLALPMVASYGFTAASPRSPALCQCDDAGRGRGAGKRRRAGAHERLERRCQALTRYHEVPWRPGWPGNYFRTSAICNSNRETYRNLNTYAIVEFSANDSRRKDGPT